MNNRSANGSRTLSVGIIKICVTLWLNPIEMFGCFDYNLVDRLVVHYYIFDIRRE